MKLSLTHDLKGENAIEAVVEKLGLTRGLPRDSEGELTTEGRRAKQELVRMIGDDTDVKWEVKSELLDLISVSVTHEDPNLAQQIPNELVKNYIESVHERLKTGLTLSLSFLKEQTTACQRRLTELDANRLAFEQEHAPLPLDSPGALVERIETTEARLADLRSEKKAAEIRLWAAETRFEQLAKSFPEQVKALAFEPTSRPATGSTTRSTTAPRTQPTTYPTSRPSELRGSLFGEARIVERTEFKLLAIQPSARQTGQPAATAPAPAYYVKAPNPEYQRLKEELRQEEDELASARITRHMEDTHPTVKTLLAKIARLKKVVGETDPEIDLPVYRSPMGPTPTTATDSPAEARGDPLQVYALNDARANWEQAIREVEELALAAGPLRKRLLDLQKLEADFAPKWQRYKEINGKIRNEQAELAGWQKRLMEVQTALGAEVAQRRTHLYLVQAAAVPAAPDPLPLGLVVGVALVGGLLFGCIVAFLAACLRRSVAVTVACLVLLLCIGGAVGLMLLSGRFAWRLGVAGL
jgi:hypothetical protein